MLTISPSPFPSTVLSNVTPLVDHALHFLPADDQKSPETEAASERTFITSSADMYSQYWSTARGRRPDYRRYTMVEGDTPLPLGSTCRRKRLRSVGEEEDDEEAQKSCARRPNPEGSLSAGELSCCGKREEEEEEEELQRLCQRCHIMTSQLSRQAAALTDTAAQKDPAYTSFLFNKLHHLQLPHHGRRPSFDARCDVCGAAFQQLRHLALRRALGISRKMAPRPATPSVPTTPTCGPQASESSWGVDDLRPKQERWVYDEQHQQGGGAPWGWGGVQSVYLGGGGAKGLATVTPLNAHNYLEGVWRVSCCRPELQQTTVLTSVGGPVTTRRPVTRAAQSTSTQTSPAPSAAAAFFIRAAQKLSLSRKKKSQPGPSSTPDEAQGPPLVFTGGFSGALQLSPPAVPPCLLRAGSKVKDTPGMGKVRVMVRVCSVPSSESSESMSFLKVDGRKKQLTLCETGRNSGSSQRRSSASAPKTFTFDAVFTQDASQAEVCSGTVSEVIQSVVNGADGCIFCFGHSNLGKTYTMIGRDCSTQSLGVAPTAISWLFKVIEERREKTGARFSVRVSAVEISGREETLIDLLAELSSSGAHQEVSLWEDPLCGSQLQNQTELRVTSAERAAFFLDAALAGRKSSRTPNDQEARRNSHFLFTLHLYQERPDKSSKAAVSGRSRLHLLDLGSCETDISRTREGGGGQCLSLSALGNVILALANGAKHVPYRDSKLTMLLSESLGNINCRTTMIAHVSDSPVNYTETLTTVQLASRIHRTRKKKSKYASSSSGGDSSCEEGPAHRPPHLQLFHPRIVALDSETPLILSSDPDYSSSSEQSCDTVIYIGPGGTAVSDRELSDNEGPPSFVPIIPSLNKKQTKDAPRKDGDHLKCNTFAELQERLDCIDGSEGPAACSKENRGEQAMWTQTEAAKFTEETSSPNSTQSTRNPDQIESRLPSDGSLMDSSKRTRADGEKLPATFIQPCLLGYSGAISQDSEPVVREKVRAGIPKLPPSQTSAPTSRTTIKPGEASCRIPPVGLSYQVPFDMDNPPHVNRYPVEVSGFRAAFLGRCLDRDFLRTTVTLQQPVELNGEDELVFTIIEELPLSFVPDNGRPSNLLSFNTDCSPQALATGSRPISIITSINDEYDAYTAQHGAEGPDCRSPVTTEDSSLSNRLQMKDDCSSILSSPRVFHRERFLQHGLKSSLHDSGVCFSELDSDPATPNKSSFIECPSPDLAKTSSKGSPKVRASTLNTPTAQIPQYTTHSSLPRKNKPTSSATVGCSRQEGRHENFLLQGSSFIDPREVEFLSAGKSLRSGTSTISSRKYGGNSNSMPRPSKTQVLSAQRVVDGCEKSTSRREATLIKLPRLTRGATTLGTVSPPQSSELKWSHEAASTIGTLRFSSLGKKSNGQNSSTISKSGSVNISPPTPLFLRSSQEQKMRSPSALKTSSNSGKFVFPKTSTSEEEFIVRLQADSFSNRTFSLKTDHGSPRTSSSLKTRGVKADSSRFYGSLMSLEICESPTSPSSKSEVFKDTIGAASGSSSKSNRSLPKLSLSASTSPSSSQVSSAFFATSSKLGQVQGAAGSRFAVSGGLKVRSLSTSSSKSSTPKLPDNAAGHNTSSLPPTGKSPARAGNGTKMGRGTIMGTKQVINRAVNSRVSELAAGRKQLGRVPGEIGSSDSETSSTNRLTLNTLPPSPYSKITAPRRPQRYSNGHGSDNSSILSGELPPAMGRTALFYHSGGSSGYESMIRDSETTGSTSSAHDSMSESGASSSNRGRVSKSPKKRGNGGFLRRRLIPAPLPDTSSLGRKAGSQWVELPPLGGALKEPFEIKVYEIDDVERLQRGREAMVGSEPFQDVEKGLLYFNARLRMLEKRQQMIRELRSKHEQLKVELEEAKNRLMLEPSKWTGDFDVDQDLNRESQEYLEALAQVTAELDFCVSLCKSRVMMETCFDVTGVATAMQEGHQGQLEVTKSRTKEQGGNLA
ncbi:kinesin-like protein KIF26A [Nematolebias whitei]|uniref:kinesin-like protein KIF26A n=1 Tax=Nematolebias whitei TaxID=451745 RepID=UPI001899BAB0|nr:kinesin-like protein KIF26A [Nematolebias whitei]